MGRKRIRGKGLPSRVVISRGWYFYIHPTEKTAAGSPIWKKLAREGHLGDMHRALANVVAGDVAGTMGALFKKYRADELPKKAPKTQKVQEKELQRLEAVYGRCSPDKITPQMVAQYLTERGAAPVAANREIALLSHVFTKGIRWLLAERNPCLGVERNEEKPRRHRIADSDLMRAWQLAKPWMRTLMALAYTVGQRKMDVARIRETDFGAKGLFVKQGKTGTELMLAWTPGLRAVKAYALSVRGEKVKPIQKWLVCNRVGGHYTDRTIRREWTRVQDELEKLGGERFQFRDIRPRSATDHADGTHLGHKDPRVLERYYRLGPRVVQPL
jgi:integrase